MPPRDPPRVRWVSTTTTDATQVNTGNGNIIHQSTTTETTGTGHPTVRKTPRVHASTDNMAAVTITTTPATNQSPKLCDGATFQVEDNAKGSLCLHVKGGVASDGSFAIANVKRPVVTMPCQAGSPNQLFTWLPNTASTGELAGSLRHQASGLLLSVMPGAAGGAPVRDGSGVTVAPAAAGQLTQAWVWSSPTSGGPLASAAATQYMITDSMVNAGANTGLPVHMWALKNSLPSGAPNAQWAAVCAN